MLLRHYTRCAHDSPREGCRRTRGCELCSWFSSTNPHLIDQGSRFCSTFPHLIYQSSWFSSIFLLLLYLWLLCCSPGIGLYFYCWHSCSVVLVLASHARSEQISLIAYLVIHEFRLAENVSVNSLMSCLRLLVYLCIPREKAMPRHCSALERILILNLRILQLVSFVSFNA